MGVLGDPGGVIEKSLDSINQSLDLLVAAPTRSSSVPHWNGAARGRARGASCCRWLRGPCETKERSGTGVGDLQSRRSKLWGEVEGAARHRSDVGGFRAGKADKRLWQSSLVGSSVHYGHSRSALATTPDVRWGGSDSSSFATSRWPFLHARRSCTTQGSDVGSDEQARQAEARDGNVRSSAVWL